MHVLFFCFFPATWWPHPLRSTRSRPPCFAATSGDWQKSRTGKTTPKTTRKRIQPIVRGVGFIHRQRTQRAAPGLLRRQHTQPAVPAQRACWQTQRAGQRDAAYWQIRQRPPGNALSPWCALPASSTEGAAARSANAGAPFASSAAHAAARSSCVHAGERAQPLHPVVTPSKVAKGATWPWPLRLSTRPAGARPAEQSTGY